MIVSRSVDLHGCKVAEAIRKFVDFYNGCVRSGYAGRIEVIHGYGSTSGAGGIKHALRGFLEANPEKVDHFIAGEGIGNPGVTIVYAKRLLATPMGGQRSESSVGSRKGRTKRGATFEGSKGRY